MIPYPYTNLGVIANRIMLNVLPDLKSEYVMSDTGMMAMLLAVMQGEMAAGIKNRMTDIDAMKGIFTDALKVIKDAGLKSDIDAVISLHPESLSMQDVNALHDKLSRMLIRLHEEAESGQLERLNSDIWRYLEEHASRYVLEVPI